MVSAIGTYVVLVQACALIPHAALQSSRLLGVGFPTHNLGGCLLLPFMPLVSFMPLSHRSFVNCLVTPLTPHTFTGVSLFQARETEKGGGCSSSNAGGDGSSNTAAGGCSSGGSSSRRREACEAGGELCHPWRCPPARDNPSAAVWAVKGVTVWFPFVLLWLVCRFCSVRGV